MDIVLIFLKILAFQIICFGIIFFILTRRLNSQLIGLALQKLEIARPESFPEDLEELSVTVHASLPEDVRQKIARIIFKKSHKSVKIAVRVDRTIRGGIIIQMKDVTLDFSLLTKLRQSGLIGKIFGV